MSLKKMISPEVFLVYGLLLLVMLSYVYKETIHFLIFGIQSGADFDTATLDLVVLENIRYEYSRSVNSLSNLLFNFSVIQSFLLPMVAIILGYSYQKIKDNYLLFKIGKTNNYYQEIFHLKIKLAGSSVALFLLIFLWLVISHYLWQTDDQNFQENLRLQFTSASFLNGFGATKNGFLLLYGFVKSLAFFVLPFLFFYLIDKIKNHTRASLVLISYFWGLSVLCYHLFLGDFAPMNALMSLSYNNLSMFQLVGPYTSYGLILSYFLFFDNYEVA